MIHFSLSLNLLPCIINVCMSLQYILYCAVFLILSLRTLTFFVYHHILCATLTQFHTETQRLILHKIPYCVHGLCQRNKLRFDTETSGINAT